MFNLTKIFTTIFFNFFFQKVYSCCIFEKHLIPKF